MRHHLCTSFFIFVATVSITVEFPQNLFLFPFPRIPRRIRGIPARHFHSREAVKAYVCDNEAAVCSDTVWLDHVGQTADCRAVLFLLYIYIYICIYVCICVHCTVEIVTSCSACNSLRDKLVLCFSPIFRFAFTLLTYLGKKRKLFFYICWNYRFCGLVLEMTRTVCWKVTSLVKLRAWNLESDRKWCSGVGGPDPWKCVGGSEYVMSPKMSHSFIQNCWWITSSFTASRMKHFCQKWKVKLHFRGAYRLSGTGIFECLEITDVGCNLKQFVGLTWLTWPPDFTTDLRHCCGRRKSTKIWENSN